MICEENKYNIYFLTQSGCFVTPSMKNPKWGCSDLQNYKKLLDKVKFEKVLTSFYSFNSYLPTSTSQRNSEKLIRIKEFDNFMLVLKSKVREIFLLTGEPKGTEFDPVFAVRNKLPDSIAETQVRINYSEHEDALTKLKNIDDINIIDPIAYLCQNKQCKTRDEKRGFYYRDNNHMRPWYSIHANSYLNNIFLL